MFFSDSLIRSEGAEKVRAFAAAVFPRLVGGLIVFKVSIPLLIVAFLAVAGWSMARRVGAELDRLDAALRPSFERVEASITTLREEGRRLAAKLDEAKGKGEKLADDLNRSVRPIRDSVRAIATAVRSVSDALGWLVNGVTGAVNSLPRWLGVPRIPPIGIPRIQLPDLGLPDLDIDLDLSFDMGSLEALKDASEKIVNEAEVSLDTLRRIWLTWWWTFKAIAVLVVCWLLISLVGLTARGWHKLKIGVQLLSGRATSASLQML